MSWTWLTGKMGMDHVRHRHGRWFRTLSKEEQGEAPKEDAGDPKH